MTPPQGAVWRGSDEELENAIGSSPCPTDWLTRLGRFHPGLS